MGLRRVGGDEGAERGAADDHELERLEQDDELAAAGDVAADDAGQNDAEPDKDYHC
jgi:hypothetical protein